MITPGYIGLAVGFLALIAASIFDIKTREVPDWLNYGLFAFSLANAVILSIYHNYSHILLESLAGFGVGLAFGLLMFYTGQWGGGDAKLIIALSALIGLSFSEFRNNIPLIFIFIINLLLVGAVYGLGFSMYKAFTNYHVFNEAAKNKLRSRSMLIVRGIIFVLSIAAFIFFLVSRSIESGVLFGMMVCLFFFFYLWVFVSIVEKICMIKKVNVNKLTEGDWIVGDVMKGKKVILKPSKIGVTLKEIALLKKNKIKEITIKVGIPFVPSFLIAYFLTFLLGNWLFFFL
ncbi:prepilin peptidase [Candidatus Woesearchaeota archaeon]|nr:prepilin peptidase [Candidatus Woesearchaeota archaeon]